VSPRAAALAGLLGLCGVAAGCGGGTKPPIEASPDPVDFGKVLSPDQPVVRLTLRNRGARSVALLRTRFDCPCFALADPLPASLAPGESATVRVVMDSTKTDPKPFRKVLVIGLDDPRTPELRIEVVGEVAEVRRWSAPKVDLGTVDRSSPPAERRLSVRGAEGFRVRATGVESSDPRVVARVEPTAEGADVLVSLGKDPRPGRLAAQIQATIVVEGHGRPPRTLVDSLWVHGTIQ
jgi:hypothetical protein